MVAITGSIISFATVHQFRKTTNRRCLTRVLIMDDRLKEILMTLRSVSSLVVFVEIANAKC